MVSALDLFATGAGASTDDPVATGPVSRVEQLASLVEGVKGFISLEPVWRRIARAAPDQSAFLSYGFAIAAARYHEERGERVFAAVVDWGGRPACILPIAVKRRGGVSIGVFLGDPIAQYGDALMVANAPARTADLALKRLAADAGVDVFEFRRVRDDAALAPALLRFARRSGDAVEAPYADLAFESDIDAFLLGVAGAKHKRERARSRRRLAERGELSFEALRGADAIEPLRHAFALKSAWLARHGEASPVIGDPRALAVFERMARDHDGEGLVVARLSVSGEPAAYEVGLVRGRRFHAYLGAVSESFAGASPGKVVMEEMLGWCRRCGVDIYDLLPPADPYKRRWSNGATLVRSFVAPMTLRGRLYGGFWLGQLKPRLRAALDAAPHALRRPIATAALRAGVA